MHSGCLTASSTFSPAPNLNPYPNPNPNPNPIPNPNPVSNPIPDLYPSPAVPSHPISDLIPNPNLNPPTETYILPLITTFSQGTQHLHHRLKHNFTTLQTTLPTFQNTTIISAYKRNKNLKDLLIRTTFTRHLKPPTPKENIYFRPHHFITNIHSHLSAPNSPLNLDTPNLVYAITCTLCHLIYIGETKHTLRIRLRQHLRNIRNNKLHTHLVIHFQTHNTSHLQTCGLEGNPGWSTAQRKRAERLWILKLNTIFPTGFNEKLN